MYIFYISYVNVENVNFNKNRMVMDSYDYNSYVYRTILLEQYYLSIVRDFFYADDT